MSTPLMTPHRGGLRLAPTAAPAPGTPPVLHLAGAVAPPLSPTPPALAQPQGRALLASRPGLRQFLTGLPMLAFTDTGRANVCRRFALTDDELTAALLAFDEGGRR